MIYEVRISDRADVTIIRVFYGGRNIDEQLEESTTTREQGDSLIHK